MAGPGIIIKIEGDGSGAAEALRMIEERMKQTARTGGEVSDQLSMFGERVQKALEYGVIDFALYKAAGALKETMQGAVDLGMELGHMSEQTGISAQNLSVLRYTAEQTGIPFETLAKGFKKMSTDIFEWVHGEKLAGEAFGDLGISMSDVQDKGQDMFGILSMVADKFQEMPDGPHKLAIAVELFGRAGQELIPILNKGSAGLSEFRSEAQQLGLVLDEAGIQKMEQLHAKAAETQGAMEGLGLTLMNTLAPALEDISTGATAAIEKLSKLLHLNDEAATVADRVVAIGKTIPDDIAGAANPGQIAAAAGARKAAIEKQLQEVNLSRQQREDLEKQWNEADLRQNQAYFEDLDDQVTAAEENLQRAKEHLKKYGFRDDESWMQSAEKRVQDLQGDIKTAMDRIDAAQARVQGLQKPPGGSDGGGGATSSEWDGMYIRDDLYARRTATYDVGPSPDTFDPEKLIQTSKQEQQAAFNSQLQTLLAAQQTPQVTGLSGSGADAVESQQDKIAGRNQDAMEAASTIGNLLDRLGNMRGKDPLRELVQEMIQDLDRLAVEMMEKEWIIPMMQSLFSPASGVPWANIGGNLSGGTPPGVLDLGYGTSDGSIPGFAGGTDSAPDGLAMVGENGPELVNLPGGSRVISNSILDSLARSGGGAPSVVIHNTNNSSQPVQMRQTGVNYDVQMKQFVLHTVLEDMEQGGPTMQAMRGISG